MQSNSSGWPEPSCSGGPVSVVGSSDGTVTRLDYDVSGSFTDVPKSHHDADADLDVDLHDLIHFQACFDKAGMRCRTVHDFDENGAAAGHIDASDDVD